MNKQLQLSVQFLDSSEALRDYSILEAFLTSELNKLIPEFDNGSQKEWKDAKERLGLELIKNQSTDNDFKYKLSLFINGALISGFVINKLFKLL